ncbi:hypothetical protein LCGC14_1140320 [marine sediment metagenome]|uniref:Sulfotransferase domain-containing protein n=1 Tax=marine sediment metagenome TaxID=412755 RepID=A0A0F9Q466_9ZZZZ
MERDGSGSKTLTIICCGMPRSASTWVYNVALEICRLSKDSPKSCGFVSLNQFDLIKWNNPEWDIIKIHSYVEKFKKLTQCVFLYSYRDVREIAASLIAMKGYQKKYVLNILHKQIIPDSLEWLNHPFRVLLPYERIIMKPISSINLIANSIGIEATKKDLNVILEKHNRKSVKRLIREKELKPDDGVNRSVSVDAETLYWHNHITSFGNKWREIFGNNSFGSEVDQWLETVELLEYNNEIRNLQLW